MTIIITAYLLVALFGYWLDFLNLAHLKQHGSAVPPEFEGQINEGLLQKTMAYNIVFLVFILVLLNIYNSWVLSLSRPFILTGLIFFLLLTYAESIISLPFSLYSTFRIENRYGFNTIFAKVIILGFHWVLF